MHDERYFNEQVAPHIDGERVTFLGAVGPQRRGEIRARQRLGADRMVTDYLAAYDDLTGRPER